MVSNCLFKLAQLLSLLGAAVYTLSFLAKSSHLFHRYKLVGRVVALFCHPVAGCKGMVGRTALCTTSGIRVMGLFDTQFVLARRTGSVFAKSSPQGMMKEFYSPPMETVEAFSDGQDLMLLAPGKDTFTLPASYFRKTVKELAPARVLEQLWRAENVTISHRLGDDTQAWVQDSISNKEVFLYHILDQISCVTPGRSCLGNCVIAVKESIDYVNKEIKPDPTLTATYFRPNIVVSGCDPLEENKWLYIKIGEAFLKVTNADSRIVSTRFKQNDKDWRASWEPVLQLPLNTACIPGPNLAFNLGVNAQVVRTGEIRVGDPVFAAYRTPF